MPIQHDTLSSKTISVSKKVPSVVAEYLDAIGNAHHDRMTGEVVCTKGSKHLLQGEVIYDRRGFKSPFVRMIDKGKYRISEFYRRPTRYIPEPHYPKKYVCRKHDTTRPSQFYKKCLEAPKAVIWTCERCDSIITDFKDTPDRKHLGFCRSIPDTDTFLTNTFCRQYLEDLYCDFIGIKKAVTILTVARRAKPEEPVNSIFCYGCGTYLLIDEFEFACPRCKHEIFETKITVKLRLLPSPIGVLTVKSMEELLQRFTNSSALALHIFSIRANDWRAEA